MAGSLGDSCDAVYVQQLACRSCHRAEAVLHLMPRAHRGGAVFALGNSGGGSLEATGQSPALLFLGHPICIRFDLLRPNLGRKVREEQARQKQSHDVHTQFCEFAVGDMVMMAAVISHSRGPVQSWSKEDPFCIRCSWSLV